MISFKNCFGHFYINCRHSKPFEIEEKRLYFNFYEFFNCRGTKGGVCYASQIVTRGFSLGEAGLGLAQPKERVKSVFGCWERGGGGKETGMELHVIVY